MVTTTKNFLKTIIAFSWCPRDCLKPLKVKLQIQYRELKQ